MEIDGRIADVSEIGARTGLEFLCGIIEGILPAPPISRTLNMFLSEADQGRVVFRGAPQFAAMNPIGSIHGGWFGMALDSCMSCAVQSCLPKGFGYTTLEYKINLLRPLMPETKVEAIGVVNRVGRRTGSSTGEVRGVADRKLYATGSATCLIFEYADI